MASQGTRFNNNYLSFPESAVDQARLPTGPMMGMNNNVYASNNQFTFGSPTQAPIITSSQSYVAPPSRGINMPQMSAPGIGTSWQHTIPRRMPWSESSTTITFSASSVVSAPSLRNVVISSTPTCSTSSSSYYNNKRHQSATEEESPPFKQFISDEKMASHMENLYIGNLPPIAVDQQTNNRLSDHGWGKFLHLEDRLHDEDMEEKPTATRISSTIKISEDIKDSIFTPRPIIPPHILDSLNKPSLEVVLWKPPEGVVGEIISKAKEGKTERNNTNCTSTNSILTSIDRINTNLDLNNDLDSMEVDFFDNLDDEMIL